MPAYTYFCKSCGHEQEVFHSIAAIDDPDFLPEVCCETPMTRQCGNAGGFQLKGGGWGEDGYDQYLGDINITRKRDGKPELDYNSIHGTEY